MSNKRSARAIRPFDQVLREINGGRLVEELTNELTEVVEAVKASGKAGKIALTITLKPRGSANAQLEVIPSVRGTKPERERPLSIFYINQDMGLQRNDPQQGDLPGMRPVRESDDQQEKTA